METTTYPVSIELRIDFSELDLLGHVNNVYFFKYLQASRINYWEIIGINPGFSTEEIVPVLASTSCQFKKQLLYPGNVLVKTGIVFIKNTSFGIHHQLFDQYGDLVAEAEDIIVMIDIKTNEKVPVTAEMRGLVEKLEGRKY